MSGISLCLYQCWAVWFTYHSVTQNCNIIPFQIRRFLSDISHLVIMSRQWGSGKITGQKAALRKMQDEGERYIFQRWEVWSLFCVRLRKKMQRTLSIANFVPGAKCSQPQKKHNNVMCHSSSVAM